MLTMYLLILHSFEGIKFVGAGAGGGEGVNGIDVTPLPFSPVQFQYNCYSMKETNRTSHSDTKKLDHFITCNIIV